MAHHEITDIVLFGDCRPIHRPAIDVAKSKNVRVHVYEEGYFRPFWVTLEAGGVNGQSSLPRNAQYYLDKGCSTLDYDNGTPFRSAFWKRVAYDIGYNFWAGLNRFFHAGVPGHVPYSPLQEYLAYAKKTIVDITSKKNKSDLTELYCEMETGASIFYLFPLQLATDSQITHHSPFSSIEDAAAKIIRSFASYAPPDAKLLIKSHPLDPGMIDYRSKILQIAQALGVCSRVVYINGGNLPRLITFSRATVTINSTVGASSLLHGKPTKVLGSAIYDIPGLTYQGTLDSFWYTDETPNMQLFKSFRNVVINETQVNGGFYCKTGIELAVRNSLNRLID
ncbi:capsular biosynthesis protein [Alcaligenaceae bacterium B3P038]|nr:capsular biosynthesis protein [Alcaligenaceae bacterium B3P038]